MAWAPCVTAAERPWTFVRVLDVLDLFSVTEKRRIAAWAQALAEARAAGQQIDVMTGPHGWPETVLQHARELQLEQRMYAACFALVNPSGGSTVAAQDIGKALIALGEPYAATIDLSDTGWNQELTLEALAALDMPGEQRLVPPEAARALIVKLVCSFFPRTDTTSVAV